MPARTRKRVRRRRNQDRFDSDSESSGSDSDSQSGSDQPTNPQKKTLSSRKSDDSSSSDADSTASESSSSGSSSSSSSGSSTDRPTAKRGRLARKQKKKEEGEAGGSGGGTKEGEERGPARPPSPVRSRSPGAPIPSAYFDQSLRLEALPAFALPPDCAPEAADAPAARLQAAAATLQQDEARFKHWYMAALVDRFPNELDTIRAASAAKKKTPKNDFQLLVAALAAGADLFEHAPLDDHRLVLDSLVPPPAPPPVPPQLDDDTEMAS